MCSPKMICMFMQIFISSISTRKTSTRITFYCELCEVPGTHTMCLYPTGDLGPDCVSHSRLTLSVREKISVIDMHNIFRNRVATGGTKLPTAADMLETEWDDELEIIAQRWANQCKFQHDICRDSERFPVGQNFGKNSAPACNFPPNHLGIIIRRWFSEINGYNPSSVDVYQGQSKTDRLTQLIWSRSYKIGCGRVNFTEGKMYGEMMFCNYGPSGNMLGGYIYEIGPPCAACPPGFHCSDRYKGLCARSSSPRQLHFVQFGIIVQSFVMVTLSIVM